MSSFLKDIKSRAEVLYHYDDEDDTTNQRRREKSHETRTLQSTAVPAAMRGLYAPPPRRRIESHPQVEQLDRVHKEEDDDPNDPIIRNSMYPQMNGKRQSELDAEVAKYAGVRADFAHAQHMARNNLQVRRRCRPGRDHRVRSVKTYTSEGDSTDSGTDSCYSSGNYSSDSNPERRPVRVYIYPQAKYIPVAVETPIKKPARFDQAVSGCTANTISKAPDSCIPSYRDWKRDMLPRTEFQKRQAMERAREALEPLYQRCHRYLYGKAKPKKGLIGHGETQWFTEPFHHGRVENSRMQYVLRKAKQAGLNHNSPEFGHTMTKRAYNVPFCEISDLAGAPVMETLLIDFLKAWRKFQDKANVPKGLQLAMVRPGELAQRLSVDGRNDLRRVDSGAMMRARLHRPVPVSHFDWDSSDDESETPTPKRLTKMKR